MMIRHGCGLADLIGSILRVELGLTALQSCRYPHRCTAGNKLAIMKDYYYHVKKKPSW